MPSSPTGTTSGGGSTPSDTRLTRRALRIGEVSVRLNSLPSDTTTVVVADIGSAMPLLTLLSERSTVARTCSGPCTVPAWKDAAAMPLIVLVSTLTPLLGPPAEVAERIDPPALPMISTLTLSTAPGFGTGWLAPSRTWMLITELVEPPEPGM